MKSRTSIRQLPSLLRRILITAQLPVALTIQFTASAAEPVVQWARVFGGSGYDWPEALALAPNGQLYLAGTFGSDVLLQFDQNGTLLGSQPYRGVYIRSVAVDAAGNYYLTGLVRNSQQLGIGLTNYFYLAKHSAGGSLIWERTGGSPSDSNVSYPWDLGGFKVILDAAGNIFVGGRSTGPAVFGGLTLPATSGAFLCKYAPDGTPLWVEPLAAGAGDMVMAPDGSIAISGGIANETTDFGGIPVSVAGPFGGDVYVAKLSASGDVQWVRVGYGGEGIVADSQGNIYFNGTTAGVTEFHCGKLDPAGNLLWEHRVGGAWSNGGVVLNEREEPVFSANLIDTLQLGDLLVPYNGLGTLVESPVALICKADSAGRFQWAVPDSGKSMTWGGKILSDRKGNVYAAGAFMCGIDQNSQFVCGTSQFGPFSLRMLHPNANNNPDIFLVRLFDADSFVPELRLAKTPWGVALSWPVEATNHMLEATTLLPAVSWSAVTNTPTVTTNERSVQLPLTGNTTFFRLRKP